MKTMALTELINLPVFPFADAFPYLSEEEEKELAQDLEVNGQQHPVVLFINEAGEILILDGRNRLKAFQRTIRVVVEVEFFEGTEFQAVEKVRALNILRRHLTVGQRAMAALAYLPYEEDEAKTRQQDAGQQFGRGQGKPETEPSQPLPLPIGRAPQARDVVAEKFNLSGPRISDAKRVALNAPDLAEGVKTGELSLDAAVKQLKARGEARDKKVRELEFEAHDLHQEYEAGTIGLDDAYVTLLNRQKEEARKQRANNNEAINLIVIFSRIADERLREFNARMQRLTSTEKIDDALGHLETIETALDTTRGALLRLRELVKE